MTVSVNDVRDELAMTSAALGLTASEFDELLQRLITRETERLETTLGVSFTEATASILTSRPSHVTGRHLPLPSTPVQSVSSITIDTDRAYGSDVAATDVIVEDTHLELRADAPRDVWPTTTRSIDVTWTHGYPEGDVPAAVDGAVIGLVRQAIQEIEADGVTSESIAGDSTTYELPETVVNRHIARAADYVAPTYGGGIQVI